MDLFSMLVMTALKLYFGIGACRIISMTFKTFCRSIKIKNRKLAEVLIAYRNTWGIATSVEKRNRMSIPGLISWVVFLPQIVFLVYDWWFFAVTGAIGRCSSEETYLLIATAYWIVMVFRNIKEAERFRKGEVM